VLTSVYWGIAHYMRAKGSPGRRLKAAALQRYVALPLFLLLLTGVSIKVTYNPTQLCHCVTDRIIVLETNAGDRDKLLEHGVQLVAESPILGTGLGSFAGYVHDSYNIGKVYQYPHNVPLEVAGETGLIGFLLIIVPLLASWVALFWKGVKSTSPAIAGVGMIVSVFFAVANI